MTTATPDLFGVRGGSAPRSSGPRSSISIVPTPGPRTEATVHRQPVVRADRTVFGYAISVLVRSSAPGPRCEDDLDRIMRSEYDKLNLGALAGTAIAFVRATTAMLVSDRPLPAPPGSLILEVPPFFAEQPDAAQHLVRLRAAGVGLALRDFRSGPSQGDLLPLVDFVKVNLGSQASAVAESIAHAHSRGTAVIAERVDTEAAVRFCAAHGVELLQGPLFLRDASPTERRLSVGELQCVELMRLLAADGVSYQEITRVIESEPELTVRVLHLVNTSAFALRARVDSVRQAVVLLGPAQLSALAAASLYDSSDQARSGLWFMLTRALTCRTLARSDAAYTVGLLSAVAARLQIAPGDLIARTGVSADVASALLALSGPYGQVLAAVLAHEENDVAAVEATGLAQLDVARAYLAAVAEAFGTVSSLSRLAP